MPAGTKEYDPSLLGVDCRNLAFAFNEVDETVLQDVHLQLPQGSRCLLVGANGGGLRGFRLPTTLTVSWKIHSASDSRWKAIDQDEGLQDSRSRRVHEPTFRCGLSRN